MNISAVEDIYSVSALDKLLAQSLATIIKTKLGEKTYQKVEDRLAERYRSSIVESIKNFHQLDATLREFFGPGADALEKDFLEHLVSLDTRKKGEAWITIENQELSRLILETYGDREKKLILDAALKKPNPVLEILEDCKIPKSTGYRLINELVTDGLLTEEGHTTTSDGKKVALYTALFENIKIDLTEGQVVIKVILKEHILQSSYLVKILLEQS
ncbi:MAG: transcriptional regulator [Nitrosopumilaceae archaeon]